MKFTISYADNGELVTKLKVVAARFGYTMQPVDRARLTVGELAALVHRPVSTVSRALKRPSCPEYVARKGQRRILWIEPNPRLISFLTNPSFGGRPTNPDDYQPKAKRE